MDIWPTLLLLLAQALSHTRTPAGFKGAQWQEKHPGLEINKITSLLMVDQAQLPVCRWQGAAWAILLTPATRPLPSALRGR